MRKYFVVLAIFTLFFGCGRVGSENSNIKNFSQVSTGKEDFDIILKSRYIQNSNSYINQGHYSLLFKYAGEAKNLDSSLFENGSKYSSSPDEATVKIDASGNSITNNILLLLDFSGSIIRNRALRDQLKTSVISFIDGVNNVKIAVYYLNSKEKITPIIADPMDNIFRLKEEINRLNDSYFERIIDENLISTNLHGGVIEASDIACNWIGNCRIETHESEVTLNKDNFEFASVVIFTDGKDQARWADEKDMFNAIKNNGALFYQGVGVGDADRELIDKISTDEGIFNENLNTESIKNVFNELTSWANSFYEAKYCPAAQKGSVDIKIEVKDRDNGSTVGFIQEKNVKLRDSEEFRCDIP